jgi:hypothetical protein
MEPLLLESRKGGMQALFFQGKGQLKMGDYEKKGRKREGTKKKGPKRE